jgi:hypothetical protein
MIDPISVGSLVALVLSTATEAVAKGVVEDATKYAYKALKEKLSQLGSAEVDALETSPGSIGRQLVVAELVDAQPKDAQESLYNLAGELAAALKKQIPDSALLWRAELLKNVPCRFVVVFSSLKEQHRIELNTEEFSQRILLDGNIIKRFSNSVGRKNINFKLDNHANKFQFTYFKPGRLFGSRKFEDIELWVDNRQIFPST